jgi:hypothetical protein
MSIQAQFPHYYKSVEGLTHIDVYRVLSLFDVTDPCIQHAVKKLLCLGSRGQKDTTKDLNEAITSLERSRAMREEDSMRSFKNQAETK